MKRPLLILAVSALVLPVFAQQTNQAPYPPRERGGKPAWKKGEQGGRMGERGRMRDMSPEEKAERQERRLQLMEKTLKEIGVTEEQRAQIKELQKKQREAMQAAYKKSSEARRKLTELEESNASQEEIFAAIDAVSETQAEQMKILARNKLAMERILGKEKYRQFMEAARKSYRNQGGRHGGAGLPPRPGMPGLPRTDGGNIPPTPNAPKGETKPPLPPA